MAAKHLRSHLPHPVTLNRFSGHPCHTRMDGSTFSANKLGVPRDNGSPCWERQSTGQRVQRLPCSRVGHLERCCSQQQHICSLLLGGGSKHTDFYRQQDLDGFKVELVPFDINALHFLEVAAPQCLSFLLRALIEVQPAHTADKEAARLLYSHARCRPRHIVDLLQLAWNNNVSCVPAKIL